MFGTSKKGQLTDGTNSDSLTQIQNSLTKERNLKNQKRTMLNRQAKAMRRGEGRRK